MNIKFTYELMNRLDFPADAKSYLGGVCETLTSDERFRGDISKAEDLYFTERTDDRVTEILDSVSSHSETHIYTVKFCFLLLCFLHCLVLTIAIPICLVTLFYNFHYMNRFLIAHGPLWKCQSIII